LGYYVEIDCKDLIIPRNKVSACLKAINALWKPNGQPAFPAGGGGTCFKGGKRIDQKWYSWVDNPPPGGYPTLVKALEAWRYRAIRVEKSMLDEVRSDYPEAKVGDVIIASFKGEKWGDDHLLYKTLAPFLRGGGSIECCGQDGERWRYLFHDGKVEEQNAELIWR